MCHSARHMKALNPNPCGESVVTNLGSIAFTPAVHPPGGASALWRRPETEGTHYQFVHFVFSFSR